MKFHRVFTRSKSLLNRLSSLIESRYHPKTKKNDPSQDRFPHRPQNLEETVALDCDQYEDFKEEVRQNEKEIKERGAAVVNQERTKAEKTNKK